MTPNEGTVDRIIRILVAAAAVLASWVVGFGSVAGIVLLAFGAWMFLTGALGYCLAYRLLNISTRPSLHRISTPGRPTVAAHH